jgi:hypothetical protein
VVVAAVAAEQAAGGVDEVAWAVGQPAVAGEEGRLAGAGEEAQVLRVGPPRDREAGLGGQLAHLRLGQLAEREPQPRERLRRDRRQHVRLVLRRVGRRPQQPVGGAARVVAGRELRGAEQIGRASCRERV